MAAALMIGIAMAAPVAYQSSPAIDPPPRPPAADPEDPADSAEPPPSGTEFLDADGNPLPADIQRELEKQFRESLPPVKTPEPARSAKPSAAAPPRAGEGEITVSGRRPRGSVIGELPPERTFSPLDIAAYGVSTIGDLMEALGPQVSDSGREESGPITLLNGRRVASFAEIAEIPAEAIERMEVFPEELALRYGYRPDRKVVNIITLQRFRSRLGELASTLSTEGGYDSADFRANYFAIDGNTRFDLGAEYSRATALLESDRDLVQLGDSADAGRYRTLLPKTERLAVNGLISGNLFDNVSSTLNGRFEVSGVQDLLGRSENGTLARDSATRAAHLGTSSHGQLGKWLWTFTGNLDHLRTAVATDILSSTDVRDRARSVNAFARADLVLNGSLLKLPAGAVSTTLGGSVEFRNFSSRSVHGGAYQESDLSRDIGAVQASLNVPIARRRAKGAALPGDLSVNANLELEQLSDFGTLRTLGYGLSWWPVKAVNLIASVTARHGAPTMEQLAAPSLATPNVRTFDFARREVADVTWVSGGNRDLRHDDRHVLRLGLNGRPLAAADLILSVDYVSTKVDDPIAPFPIVTPEIEAAFPERFTRGGDGHLMRIDARPLNFEKSSRTHLRWGASFSRPLGEVEPWLRTAPVRTYASEAEARAAAAPGTIVTMVQPGSAMARRLENMASRLYVSLYHTWQLRDEVLIRENSAPLDLLDGRVIETGGGTRRHRLELQAGVFKRGLGARVTVNWQSGTTLRDSGGSAGDLAFSQLATVDVHLFANLADRFGGPKAPQWLKGVRTIFSITNLFDSRPEVRDATGSTPLSYQPGYLDPIGRFIGFSLRKIF